MAVHQSNEKESLQLLFSLRVLCLMKHYTTLSTVMYILFKKIYRISQIPSKTVKNNNHEFIIHSTHSSLHQSSLLTLLPPSTELV